jgi:hypothetical protein
MTQVVRGATVQSGWSHCSPYNTADAQLGPPRPRSHPSSKPRGLLRAAPPRGPSGPSAGVTAPIRTRRATSLINHADLRYTASESPRSCFLAKISYSAALQPLLVFDGDFVIGITIAIAPCGRRRFEFWRRCATRRAMKWPVTSRQSGGDVDADYHAKTAGPKQHRTCSRRSRSALHEPPTVAGAPVVVARPPAPANAPLPRRCHGPRALRGGGSTFGRSRPEDFTPGVIHNAENGVKEKRDSKVADPSRSC